MKGIVSAIESLKRIFQNKEKSLSSFLEAACKEKELVERLSSKPWKDVLTRYLSECDLQEFLSLLATLGTDFMREQGVTPIWNRSVRARAMDSGAKWKTAIREERDMTEAAAACRNEWEREIARAMMEDPSLHRDDPLASECSLDRLRAALDKASENARRCLIKNKRDKHD